ncbi:hypothetical protein SAMN05444064_10945 [Pseudomonas syringae]|nr:hypothetical protein SAMN05444514_10945 [Pseudomonas syringae]SFM09455.1 hypothetical protein SAMN05444064_10945 [Pseudomonas syringae]
MWLCGIRPPLSLKHAKTCTALSPGLRTGGTKFPCTTREKGYVPDGSKKAVSLRCMSRNHGSITRNHAIAQHDPTNSADGSDLPPAQIVGLPRYLCVAPRATAVVRKDTGQKKTDQHHDPYAVLILRPACKARRRQTWKAALATQTCVRKSLLMQAGSQRIYSEGCRQRAVHFAMASLKVGGAL